MEDHVLKHRRMQGHEFAATQGITKLILRNRPPTQASPDRSHKTL